MAVKVTLLVRRTAALAVLAMVAFTVWAWGAVAPAAATDGCGQVSEVIFECGYAGESVPKYTKRFFSAPGGTNLRRWFWNEIADGYGGGVYKCAGVMRGSDGAVLYLICGTAGFLGAEIAPGYRPGYVFLEQRANGPRILWGRALHTVVNG